MTDVSDGVNLNLAVPTGAETGVSGVGRSEVPPHPKPAPSKWWTVAVGRRFWLCFSMGRGEDRYFISKGSRRVLHTFPLTEEGWVEAWTRFVELEPEDALEYAAKQERDARPAEINLALGYKAAYMGGLPAFPSRDYGVLRLSGTQLGLGDQRPERAIISLADMESVEVTSSTVAKSKVAATLAFGVLGGVGSRGTKTEVAVVVRMKSGDIAYYLIPDSVDGPLTIRAKMGPILQRAGVPFADDGEPQPPQAVDVADQLRKLATLRDEGVLTPQEFDQAKAKLLA